MNAKLCRVVAEKLAIILWPTRLATVEVYRSQGQYRARVVSANHEVLASVLEASEKRASMRLLQWVCDATSAKIAKELDQ